MAENAQHDDWDMQKAVNGPDLSSTAAGIISESGIDRGTISGPFLGLAAGMGIAELDLARRFGLSDVTLVDRDQENLPGFNGEYIASDLFSFLNQSRKKFGLVTTFGIEYVLKDPNNWRSLWKGLENVTRLGSVVLTYPHDNNFTLPSGSTFDVKDSGNIFIAQRTR